MELRKWVETYLPFNRLTSLTMSREVASLFRQTILSLLLFVTRRDHITYNRERGAEFEATNI